MAAIIDEVARAQRGCCDAGAESAGYPCLALAALGGLVRHDCELAFTDWSAGKAGQLAFR